MVNYMLMITAELENLTDLQPQGGCDDPTFTYYIKLKCGNCGEVSPKDTCVSLDDTVSVPNSRGTTNLAQKCKFCSRDGTVTMISGRGRPLTQEMSESGKYTPLMLFDIRGLEPVEFSFGDGWKVESTKLPGMQIVLVCGTGTPYLMEFSTPGIEGTKFEDIDLSAGEFAEYDEKGECGVMISNLRATFTVVK